PGILLAQELDRRPMAGRLASVQDPRLGEHDGAGTDRADDRALPMALPDPRDPLLPPANRIEGAVDGDIADDDDIGLAKRRVRHDRYAERGFNRRTPGGNDPRLDPADFGPYSGDLLPTGADRKEHLVEAVDRTRRRFGKRQQR